MHIVSAHQLSRYSQQQQVAPTTETASAKGYTHRKILRYQNIAKFFTPPTK